MIQTLHADTQMPNSSDTHPVFDVQPFCVPCPTRGAGDPRSRAKIEPALVLTGRGGHAESQETKGLETRGRKGKQHGTDSQTHL